MVRVNKKKQQQRNAGKSGSDSSRVRSILEKDFNALKERVETRSLSDIPSVIRLLDAFGELSMEQQKTLLLLLEDKDCANEVLDARVLCTLSQHTTSAKMADSTQPSNLADILGFCQNKATSQFYSLRHLSRFKQWSSRHFISSANDQDPEDANDDVSSDCCSSIAKKLLDLLQIKLPKFSKTFAEASEATKRRRET